ncbi:methylenetetrahydrofolate reductase [Actinoplanes sp. NPDC049596]|uniref:methylenetetrahydrofolate reductase n=1 Tax=unclassified Actinoplanes TaxID=2626549 RepID=UPI003428D0A1
MSCQPNPATAVLSALLTDFSLEMTGKDKADLTSAQDLIPDGTRINVTFLGAEDAQLRVAAAQAVREGGFSPVPHISARRLASRGALDAFLSGLRSSAGADDVLVVGGDLSEARGPYVDALSIIESGRLERHGIRRVSVAGYPEGHPDIGDDVLWAALSDKTAALQARGLSGEIITQFSFDAGRVLDWLATLRGRGITATVRIGVPGPAGVRRLMRYAARFGVGTSAGIARKYGLSIANLMATAGPDRFLEEFARDHDPERHGPVKIHLYTFGGLSATSRWIEDFRSQRLG